MLIRTKQLFVDANRFPDEQRLKCGLKQAYPIFSTFIENLKTRNIFLMDYRYYNDGKAWLSKGEYHYKTKRGTQKVKPIFWLSFWEGYFKVSFNFAAETKEMILQLPISNDTKEKVLKIKENGNTKKYIALIFDVYDDSKLKDIYAIAEFRKNRI